MFPRTARGGTAIRELLVYKYQMGSVLTHLAMLVASSVVGNVFLIHAIKSLISTARILFNIWAHNYYY
jgi:hypothetical protein